MNAGISVLHKRRAKVLTLVNFLIKDYNKEEDLPPEKLGRARKLLDKIDATLRLQYKKLYIK